MPLSESHCTCRWPNTKSSDGGQAGTWQNLFWTRSQDPGASPMQHYFSVCIYQWPQVVFRTPVMDTLLPWHHLHLWSWTFCVPKEVHTQNPWLMSIADKDRILEKVLAIWMRRDQGWCFPSIAIKKKVRTIQVEYPWNFKYGRDITNGNLMSCGDLQPKRQGQLR